jgi:hypothetical protein
MKRTLRLLGLALAVVSAPAAAGRTISAEPVDDVKIRIDGDLREWPNKMTNLGDTLEGKASGDDPRVAATIAYDENSLYVVLKVFDHNIVRTPAAGDKEDHATLYLYFPKGQSYAVDLFPGQPGKVAGAIKIKGAPAAQSKIVEAPMDKGAGLFVEAQIPWTAFPEAARTRVGLHATVTYTDADSPGSVKAVIGTSGARSGKAMPPLLLANEQGLEESIIRAKGLPPAPAREAYGNVSGDSMVERVAVWGGNLVIIGPHFRGGKEYYFADLGVDSAAQVDRLELVDFDGDGHDEVVVQKKVGSSDKYREVLTVIKVDRDDKPFLAFAHEVGIKTSDGEIMNKVKLSKAGIEIAQGEAEGFDPGTFSEVQPGDMGATILPWESIGSHTFAWKGKGFESTGDTSFTPKQSTGAPAGKKSKARPKSDEPPAPPAPRPPTSDELLDRVYALYKKDRGASGRPSYDFVTDVAGDRGPERVLIHGKDIVVFGKGFREGLSYAFIAVGVADPKDILDATARDLTGDGKAEIIVRAVLHAKASKALGGDTVDRHAVMVYGVQGDGLVRIFGAETGRALGKDQIIGAVAFTPVRRGFDIELRPARAVGWTEQNYPFPVDTTTAGGLEPLLLPWSGGSRKYHYDGKSFAGP